MTGKLTIPFEEITKEVLSDPKTAAMYLEEFLEDGDIELFKAALKDVAAARVGSMAELARETNISRTSLYQSLSKKGNPGLNTLHKVLHAAGLRMSIAPDPAA